MMSKKTMVGVLCWLGASYYVLGVAVIYAIGIYVIWNFGVSMVLGFRIIFPVCLVFGIMVSIWQYHQWYQKL